LLWILLPYAFLLRDALLLASVNNPLQLVALLSDEVFFLRLLFLLRDATLRPLAFVNRCAGSRCTPLSLFSLLLLELVFWKSLLVELQLLL
jgi:hypothetical protein